MNEIPVYLFTGFMDSGKTSLIKDTLFEQGFAKEGKSLVICCEDGDAEFTDEELEKNNVKLVMVDSEADFTEDFLKKVNTEYQPEQVFLEYNGTWQMGTLMDMELPKYWMIVQQLATVDATTFDMYLANMRTMIMEQLFSADVVIFNRCDDSTDKGKYRRNVKALNRKAQLVYERADGTLDERPEELPFDITADEIEISDADYAIWYMDCQDNPKKYEGKKVSFLALVYNPDKLKKGIMVPGRFAMTCCVEDVTFIGFKTKYDREDEIPHKSWINITAEVHVEFAKEYKGKGPVLYPSVSNVPVRYLENNMRVYADFTILQDANPGSSVDHYVRVNDLQKLLTKPIVPYTEAISDSLGMDPIELPEYWIANDFITFRFFYAGGAKEHMVNLTKHEELTADGKTLLEFRHNAYGDPENKSLYGYVSFPLKELFNEVTDSVQLHIKYKGFEEERTIDITYRPRK